jgi:hypothetical protein
MMRIGVPMPAILLYISEAPHENMHRSRLFRSLLVEPHAVQTTPARSPDACQRAVHQASRASRLDQPGPLFSLLSQGVALRSHDHRQQQLRPTGIGRARGSRGLHRRRDRSHSTAPVPLPDQRAEPANAARVGCLSSALAGLLIPERSALDLLAQADQRWSQAPVRLHQRLSGRGI